MWITNVLSDLHVHLGTARIWAGSMRLGGSESQCTPGVLSAGVPKKVGVERNSLKPALTGNDSARLLTACLPRGSLRRSERNGKAESLG